MSQLRFILLLFGFTLSAWLPLVGVAQAAEEMTWADLVPPFDQSKDPFIALNQEQQDALYELVWGRDDRQRSGGDMPPSGDEIEARRVLGASGLDPDNLLSQLDAYDREVAIWNETLVDELDGKDIRIAGYALPLEFSETAITEFLLVPYIGACIHVPPPPTNQIVHVRVEEGFKNEGLFTPVWVTGRVSTQPQSLSLDFVDGSGNVSVGYGLKANTIEPYE